MQCLKLSHISDIYAYITYMQSLKQAMNELIYKTQKQTHRHKEQICGGRGVGGMD